MLIFVAAPFAAPQLRAEPLDKESCVKLETERRALLNREMQEALDRGPDWVKDNLSQEKIERVRHFLGVEEQLQFRCRKDGFPAGVGVTIMLMPDRNPVRLEAQKSGAKPSQALADSDKTRPDKAKAATR
jgi:hypothetical protein